ncbi:unnamed protein product, partial [marine sediment metagenome]
MNGFLFSMAAGAMLVLAWTPVAAGVPVVNES